MRSDDLNRFIFSVVRFVADPIRDEALNVGVIVMDPQSGFGRMMLDPRRNTRVKRLTSKHYSTQGLEAALRGVRSALGIDGQLEFGEFRKSAPSAETLAKIAAQFQGQLQLSTPRAHLASNLDAATNELFARFVGRPRAARLTEPGMTRAEVKAKIWHVVQRWQKDQLKVERDQLLDGSKAKHATDVVISNGHRLAALFALPSHPDERYLAYIYRDSLPTIAQDLGELEVYAVVPGSEVSGAAPPDTFTEETKRLLGHKVKTIDLSGLDRLHENLLTKAGLGV